MSVLILGGMMVRINKERQEKIRKEIIEAAHEMFYENGYDQTSTSKIAKKVGIAEGTVFNYFKTKADILMAVLSIEYASDLELRDPIDLKKGVVEIYYNYYKTSVEKIFSLPKRFLLDTFMVILKLSRKKPDIIKQLADYDFKFIDELIAMTETLIDNKLLKQMNSRLFAENIYSAIAYEVMIYLYEKDQDKERLNEKVRDKIAFLVEGYKEV